MNSSSSGGLVEYQVASAGGNSGSAGVNGGEFISSFVSHGHMNKQQHSYYHQQATNGQPAQQQQALLAPHPPPNQPLIYQPAQQQSVELIGQFGGHQQQQQASNLHQLQPLQQSSLNYFANSQYAQLYHHGQQHNHQNFDFMVGHQQQQQQQIAYLNTNNGLWYF